MVDFKRLSKTPALMMSHQRQKSIYQSLFKDHGVSPLSLHWMKRESQTIRFETFLRVANLNNQKILDLGCGFADFYSFLKSKNIPVSMTGFDIVPEFIKTAKKRYPEAHFKNKNILLSPCKNKFDYVFSSGMYAFGNQRFFEEMTKAAFDLAEKAYCFNFFLSPVDYFFVKDRNEITDFCFKLNPKEIKIFDDYLENDMTVVLYK